MEALYSVKAERTFYQIKIVFKEVTRRTCKKKKCFNGYSQDDRVCKRKIIEYKHVENETLKTPRNYLFEPTRSIIDLMLFFS